MYIKGLEEYNALIEKILVDDKIKKDEEMKRGRGIFGLFGNFRSKELDFKCEYTSIPCNPPMKFKDAYFEMTHGRKITLPEWFGYWYWDKKAKTIIIHNVDGSEIDIRETKDVKYTFDFICREDWKIWG